MLDAGGILLQEKPNGPLKKLNPIAYIYISYFVWMGILFKVLPMFVGFYHGVTCFPQSHCGMTNSTCADHPGSSWDSHPTRFGWRGSCQGADQVQCGTSEIAQPRHLGSNEVVARCGEVVGVLNGIQWLFNGNFLFWRVLMNLWKVNDGKCLFDDFERERSRIEARWMLWAKKHVDMKK